MKRLSTLSLSMLALVVSGCGGSSSSSDVPESSTAVNVDGEPTLTTVYSFQTTQTSPTAEQVLSCSTLFIEDQSCDVADITPIGAQITDDLSIDDIKSRLVISHDWMADSFIAALEEIDDQELLNLFKPLNTIVISYDINPSFYHAYTASMYIDPRYLWRDADEWETIYEQDDYREDYQTEFTFSFLRRFVDESSGDYVLWSNSYDSDYYYSRTSTQIAPTLYRLLVHELAHANDFLPSEALVSLGDSGTIYDYISDATHIYEQLSESIPLTSELLDEAAQIAYQGEDMSDVVLETSAADAGAVFSDDGAAHFYSYSTQMEDVAMLFETYMMYKKYGAVSDVAFTTMPTSDTISCDDYVLKWGERNRLADENVKQRAILVSDLILAGDSSAELADLASAPTAFATDIGWCTSRTSLTSSTTYSITTRSSQQVVHDYQDDLQVE